VAQFTFEVPKDIAKAILNNLDDAELRSVGLIREEQEEKVYIVTLEYLRASLPGLTDIYVVSAPNQETAVQKVRQVLQPMKRATISFMAFSPLDGFQQPVKVVTIPHQAR